MTNRSISSATSKIASTSFGRFSISLYVAIVMSVLYQFGTNAAFLLLCALGLMAEGGWI